MLTARENGDEQLEDSLLDELDVKWYALSPVEQREISSQFTGD